ncbi:MAG: nucleotidyltransferase domain-containing protein [Anaerolineae bacterium]|nr:nucleotidyltransferase domain-containing protein [Anaerolineae bacterium]
MKHSETQKSASRGVPIDRSAYDAALQEIIRRLIREYRPERIILYGSMVSGQVDDDSDIDLLIVKETDQDPLSRRVTVRRLVADRTRRMPFSPLVVTPEELRRRLQLGDPFYEQILDQGKVLYPDG